MGFVYRGTWSGIIRGPELFENLVSPRLGERPSDTRKLPISKANAFRRRHPPQTTRSQFSCPETGAHFTQNTVS